MLTVRSGPVAGLVGLVALLAALEATVGVTRPGWVLGLTCGVVVNAVVFRGLARSGADAAGPADLVTLTRATLACGVAALVVDSFLHRAAVATLVALTVAALVLDAVDGWVARRTRTASRFGARMDGEVDAFLILVLSVYVAPSAGWWVLAIGAARYLFAVAGWGLPWLRATLPPRYWRKVVTAAQGVVLTFAAADVLPRWSTSAALVLALALIAESFGRDVWWAYRHRSTYLAERDLPPGGPRRRTAATGALDALAVLVVWLALVAPNHPGHLAPSAFLRIPGEGLVLAGLALVLPSWGRRAMAAVVGVLLGLLTIVKALDIGFFGTLDRPFDLVTDRSHLASAVGVVRESAGTVGATLAVAAAAALAVTVLVCMPVSVGRLSRLVAGHRSRSFRAVAGLLALWVACAVSDLRIGWDKPIASTDAGRLAVGRVRMVASGVRDLQRFDAAAAVDRFRYAAAGDLAGLHGKDVLLVFVESYGRTAVEGSASSAGVRAVLDAGTARLHASGYSSRSAYLTSPTFGALSWLAHATLQSGLWVDNQWHYDRLLSGDRTTLSRAFGRAGWRTVAVMPSNDERWPEGETFYRFDEVYDRRNIDYLGPDFGFASMPDQYALSAFHRLELAERDRGPVMAQITLASSHAPWAPLPRMVEWDGLGDGSVFDRIHARAGSADELWRHPGNVPAAYQRSIAYSLRAVVSFVEEYGDDDLVVILLGDHQPAAVVSGHGASRDVPVTVIAKDPSVVDRISGWGWPEGLRPRSRAPVWPMDAFRDRFLTAYSPQRPPMPALSASAPRPRTTWCCRPGPRGHSRRTEGL